MAYILHTDGTREVRSEAEAEKLWLIKVGRARPTNEAQEKYVKLIRSTIKKVKLNWRTAPDEYIRANFDEVIEAALQNWSVDRSGNPLRPQTDWDLAFAIKWGLWYRNKPTALVTGAGQLQLV